MLTNTDKLEMPKSRVIDLITSQWNRDDTNEALEDISNRDITPEIIKGYLMKLDARLSWIEGALADADVSITKRD